MKLGAYVKKEQIIQRIKLLWLMQLALSFIFAGLCAIMASINAGKSALLGGLACIVPNAYFAYKLFTYQGARAARQIVNSFYKGEALKIILSILLFTLVFTSCTITPWAFFAAYILILMTHWFCPWIIANKQNRPESD